MEGKLGVKETKDLVNLIVDLAKAGVEIAKDGKISVEDATVFFRVIPSIGPAFEGIKEVPAELKDLDVSEAAELCAHVAARLSLDNAKAQAIVEKSLKVLVSVYELIVTIKA